MSTSVSEISPHHLNLAIITSFNLTTCKHPQLNHPMAKRWKLLTWDTIGSRFSNAEHMQAQLPISSKKKSHATILETACKYKSENILLNKKKLLKKKIVCHVHANNEAKDFSSAILIMTSIPHETCWLNWQISSGLHICPLAEKPLWQLHQMPLLLFYYPLATSITERMQT